MRLWSLHPKYLDAKGLVAVWREALLAKHVLAGKTVGYKHHPQLDRFKQARSPVSSIDRYLLAVYQEATVRGYRFDRSKIGRLRSTGRITVTRGQLKYEWSHLMKKLKQRDPKRYKAMVRVRHVDQHPLFSIVNGGIEKWEVVSGTRWVKK